MDIRDSYSKFDMDRIRQVSKQATEDKEKLRRLSKKVAEDKVIADREEVLRRCDLQKIVCELLRNLETASVKAAQVGETEAHAEFVTYSYCSYASSIGVAGSVELGVFSYVGNPHEATEILCSEVRAHIMDDNIKVDTLSYNDFVADDVWSNYCVHVSLDWCEPKA